MYKIKQLPEDFIVNEISNIELKDKGRYSYFLLKKRNYTTLRATERIAEALHIHIKHIGFAGNKDKVAITEQMISIKGITEEKATKLKLKDIHLVYKGSGDEPISIGDLKANHFIITIRNLTKRQIDNLSIIKQDLLLPNYFGLQRFSKNNARIGKYIIKKDFRKAINLITKDSDYKEDIKEHLSKNRNDYIGALRKIPKKLLKIYIHSYQSLLWNQTAKEHIAKNGLKDTKIPIIGFGTETRNEIILNIMKKENITYRDFIIRELPELSVEGGERQITLKPENFKIESIEDDELSKAKKKAIVSFSLPKSCYATVVIEHIFQYTKKFPCVHPLL